MILSITRLKLARVRFFPKFLNLSKGSIDQAGKDPQCLGGATYFGPGIVAWTATLWPDEEDMIRYVRGGDHKVAMPHLAQLCSEAATTHFQTDRLWIPQKSEILECLLKEPKFFKLQSPSREHVSQIIPAKDPFFRQIFKSTEK